MLCLSGLALRTSLPDKASPPSPPSQKHLGKQRDPFAYQRNSSRHSTILLALLPSFRPTGCVYTQSLNDTGSAGRGSFKKWHSLRPQWCSGRCGPGCPGQPSFSAANWMRECQCYGPVWQVVQSQLEGTHANRMMAGLIPRDPDEADIYQAAPGNSASRWNRKNPIMVSFCMADVHAGLGIEDPSSEREGSLTGLICYPHYYRPPVKRVSRSEGQAVRRLESLRGGWTGTVRCARHIGRLRETCGRGVHRCS